jgi:hypothetical protein
MVQTLALTTYLGLPVVVYGGILTLSLVLFTATVGFLNYKGKHIIPFKWHPRLAALTITVAVIHAFLGLSIFLRF